MLQAFHRKGILEAGCDEAGRGCLAGPVYAAAVILPGNFHHPLLNDSKQLSAPERESLVPVIKGEALAWAVGVVSPEEIDRVNILNASFLAMHRALEQLDPQPESVLVDGNRFKPYRKLPFHCIIQGDGHYFSIAAASVLAKTSRDAYMAALHAEYPHFGWSTNKGYPTVEHRKALLEHGPCCHHRRSFRLFPEGKQGNLFAGQKV